MDAVMPSSEQSKNILTLKASLHPFTALEVRHHDADLIAQQLQSRLQQAPELLKFAPVVVTFALSDTSTEQAQAIIGRLRQLDFIPVGVKNLKAQQALALSLPLFNDNNPHKKTSNPPMSQCLVVRHVRSGQQVVNENGDVVVLGNVGQGAEVLASGNIHIHGHLSGRALAGISGNPQATISCHKLQAELVSVSGHYLISEDLPSEHWQQTCVITVDKQSLSFQSP